MFITKGEVRPYMRTRIKRNEFLMFFDILDGMLKEDQSKLLAFKVKKAYCVLYLLQVVVNAPFALLGSFVLVLSTVIFGLHLIPKFLVSFFDRYVFSTSMEELRAQALKQGSANAQRLIEMAVKNGEKLADRSYSHTNFNLGVDPTDYEIMSNGLFIGLIIICSVSVYRVFISVDDLGL